MKMGRKNDKEQLFSYENSIKKSNELSIAEMNKGLTLNQMQLFAYAIFSTQKSGKTEFRKHEFEKKFSISQFRSDDAMDDAYRLLDLKIQIREKDQEIGRGHNVFTDYYYDNGLFSFKWNDKFIPHILKLKEKYIMTDLTIASKFKSGFSWILYDYLKAHYAYWHKKLTKEQLMQLFSVEDVKSYQRNTSIFKNKVIEVAIRELNKFTEYEVWYTDIRKGRSITGFILHWSVGKRISSATVKQIELLKEIHNEVDRNIYKYLSIENPDYLSAARIDVLEIKGINEKLTEGLTSSEASDLILKAKSHYESLQGLLKKDGDKTAEILQFNWLEDI